MIGLQELLSTRGFTVGEGRVKLVRHKDDRMNIDALARDGWLETYQQYQDKPVFDSCRQIVSFVGEFGTTARLFGVFDVGKRLSARDSRLPIDCPHLEWLQNNYCYELLRKSGFEDLEGRVLIDWGKNTISWHQYFTDREVLEVRRTGRSLPPFNDYLDVSLSYFQLADLVRNEHAHRDWVAALKAVGGVYLIVDRTNGAQYVGSATGIGGIWQRWNEYAVTGHGGNVVLRDLCESGNYPNAFRYSILQTFPRTLSIGKALASEAFFKEKLGSRAFGLNRN